MYWYLLGNSHQLPLKYIQWNGFGRSVTSVCMIMSLHRLIFHFLCQWNNVKENNQVMDFLLISSREALGFLLGGAVTLCESALLMYFFTKYLLRVNLSQVYYGMFTTSALLCWTFSKQFSFIYWNIPVFAKTPNTNTTGWDPVYCMVWWWYVYE